MTVSGTAPLLEGTSHPALLSLDSIEKWYGGTPALSGVSFDCRPGEIHALIGENGSGKSTLLKVASGEIRPDAGSISVEGRSVRFHQPSDAIRAGVALIAQEVPLVASLTVAENISLGALPARRLVVDWKSCRKRARASLALLGEKELDVTRDVNMLTADTRQLVAIARALARGQRILLLDEPTSSLSLGQANRLFAVLRELRHQGIAIAYVTQRLAELEQIADRVTVIRDGRAVATMNSRDASPGDIAELMVGRPLGQSSGATGGARKDSTDPLLHVEDLRMPPALRRASLTVFPGEVVGIAGLEGSGASELLAALAGVGTEPRGKVLLRGVPLPLNSVRAAMARGVGFLPRDRRLEALVPMLSVAENMHLSELSSLWPPFVGLRRRRREATTLARRFSIRMPGIEAPAAALSGGNQQKLVMARVLARDPSLLLLSEPTRGVDIGAKIDIFRAVRDYAHGEKAAVVYSSEFKDLIEWCDRIVVLYRGHTVGAYVAGSLDEEDLIHLAGGAAAVAVGGDVDRGGS
ncbi:MAG: sugar ABC transporter ATP-binding protein [Acidimicrobiales bacterium]|jgi:ABC-type sugar transport system ATPase subunit